MYFPVSLEYIRNIIHQNKIKSLAPCVYKRFFADSFKDLDSVLLLECLIQCDFDEVIHYGSDDLVEFLHGY